MFRHSDPRTDGISTSAVEESFYLDTLLDDAEGQIRHPHPDRVAGLTVLRRLTEQASLLLCDRQIAVQHHRLYKLLLLSERTLQLMEEPDTEAEKRVLVLRATLQSRAQWLVEKFPEVGTVTHADLLEQARTAS